jgi:hypothetical protein
MSDEKDVWHDEKGRFKPGGSGRKPNPPAIELPEDYAAIVRGNVSLAAWAAIVERAVKEAIRGNAKARDWLSRILVDNAISLDVKHRNSALAHVVIEPLDNGRYRETRSGDEIDENAVRILQRSGVRIVQIVRSYNDQFPPPDKVDDVYLDCEPGDPAVAMKTPDGTVVHWDQEPDWKAIHDATRSDVIIEEAIAEALDDSETPEPTQDKQDTPKTPENGTGESEDNDPPHKSVWNIG